jgi:hypothetical protein
VVVSFSGTNTFVHKGKTLRGDVEADKENCRLKFEKY